MSGRPLVLAVLIAAATACSVFEAPVPSPTVGPRPTTGAAIPLRVLVTREEGGGPVAGARVCVGRVSAATPSCTSAGADGTATLYGSSGTYFVRVSGPAEQHFEDATRVVDLAGGPAGIWVELRPLQRISGTVRDASGALVAGAEACAHPAKDEEETICARSGANGRYAIDVKSGIYRLEVSGPDGGRLVSQWARGRAFLEEADVLDARSTDVPDVDVTLVPGVVLRGAVTFRGTPVEDAQVCLRTLAAPLPLQCERTDKRGRYAALREAGQYYIWTVPPRDVRAIPQWYDRALTGVGSSIFALHGDRSLDIALEGGTTISGVVRASDGERIRDALVCFDTPFPTGRICRETGSDGSYAVTTRPETYVVNVIPPEHSDLIAEYWERARTWPEADAYRVGTTDATLDLTLRRGTRVNGVVRNGRGIGVAGGYVELWDADGIAAATQTDSEGLFELVVVPGRYRLEVFPPYVGNLVGRIGELEVPALTEVVIVLDDVAP
ncbi:MAG TPA: carboxypeptidase-like regulatory domain-containing protein [Candidatus Limnocylindria bacterium]|nr:carboxypeptidase-like regulatory domain-containing protein [Candidatus Limnocylindria bacterium]